MRCTRREARPETPVTTTGTGSEFREGRPVPHRPGRNGKGAPLRDGAGRLLCVRPAGGTTWVWSACQPLARVAPPIPSRTSEATPWCTRPPRIRRQRQSGGHRGLLISAHSSSVTRRTPSSAAAMSRSSRDTCQRRASAIACARCSGVLTAPPVGPGPDARWPRFGRAPPRCPG